MKKYIITLFSLLALAQVSAWADKYDSHVSALSGNGHTITVNYTAGDDYCAPFRYVSDSAVFSFYVQVP